MKQELTRPMSGYVLQIVIVYHGMQLINTLCCSHLWLQLKQTLYALVACWLKPWMDCIENCHCMFFSFFQLLLSHRAMLPGTWRGAMLPSLQWKYWNMLIKTYLFAYINWIWFSEKIELFFCWGHAGFHSFLCVKSQDPKAKWSWMIIRYFSDCRWWSCICCGLFAVLLF